MIRRPSLKASLFLGLFLIAFFLAIYETRDLIRGPEIIVNTPQNGATASSSLLIIEGQVKRISELTLNDRPIFADQNGNFKESLLLPYGYTILKLEAADRFGRSTKKILEIVFH